MVQQFIFYISYVPKNHAKHAILTVNFVANARPLIIGVANKTEIFFSSYVCVPTSVHVHLQRCCIFMQLPIQMDSHLPSGTSQLRYRHRGTGRQLRDKVFKTSSMQETTLCILCLWLRASLICINNCPTRCNTKQSIYYSASSLDMFRWSTTSIIRSTQNCNYSLRYCAATSLQLGQASLATLEGGSCTKQIVLFCISLDSY